MTTQPRHDAQTILIYLDSYEHDIPSGRFYSPSLGESGSFGSMSQMLMRIDACLDIQNAPQTFCRLRSFSPLVDLWPDNGGGSCRPGEVATFSVRFLFRRNASWQGTVTWLEAQEAQPFRSALELISLIISAAGGTQALSPGMLSFARDFSATAKA